MSLTWEIGGVDKSSVIRLLDGENAPGWVLSQCAYRGQVGTGGILLDDTAGSYTLPGQKEVTVDESAASPDRLFTGFVAERGAQKGPMAPGQRQWDATLEDLNAHLDDDILGSDGDREAETDVARVLWLVSALGTISVGHVPNTNTVQMDAIDYRGRNPRELLEDCAQKSGKNFFLYDTGSGYLLFYDLSTGSNLSSTLQISDDVTEVDGTTIIGPANVSRKLDPARVYSTVRVRYKRGVVTVTDSGTESTYRRREKYLRYMKVKTHDRAVEIANKWLDQASEESESLSLDIVLGRAQLNDIIAGHRVEVKLARHGVSSFTWYRVIRRDVTPISDVRFKVHLEFADKIRPTKFQSGGEDVDDEHSNTTGGDDDEDDTDARVIIDSGGITVENGAISVVNSDGVTIIDGSSQMLLIVASVQMNVPKNTVRGVVKKEIWVRTGLSVDPLTIWSMKRPGLDGDWAQPIPAENYTDDGRVVEAFLGRARYNRRNGNDGTIVQGLKFTSRPPMAPQGYRVRITRQTAF